MIPGAGSPHIARLGRAMAAGGRPRLNAGAKKAYNPGRVLRNLPTNAALSGRQIGQAAHALTALETLPTIKGYHQIIGQLGQAKGAQDQAFANLGQRTTQNVSGVYRNIAESEAKTLASQEALGSKLNERSGQIAAQGNQELTGMQTGSLSQLTSQLAMRGAPGGGEAQQQLANAVASQRATQQADSQAAQQFAASQAGNYAGLLAGEAGATQMRGGETVGQIGRDIAARTAESDQKFNQSIQTAQGKLGEARAAYGPDLIKNLLALRGGEQKAQLGQEALGVNQGKLAAQMAHNRMQNARSLEKNSLTGRNISSQEALRRSQIGKNNRAGRGGLTPAEANKIQGYERSARSLIPGVLKQYGKVPQTPDQQSEFAAGLAKAAKVPTYVAAQIMRQWLHNRAAREHEPGHMHR